MKDYVIKYGDKEFAPSEYQRAIFHNVEYGTSNMIINAAAGASKSTTIINCISLINSRKKVLFIAFNKDIVDSIKTKIGNRKNASIMTFHSLGLSIVMENIDNVPDDFVNEFKYRKYVKNNIDILTQYGETVSLGKAKNAYINNIINLVDYSRYYLAFTIKEIKRIADKYGLLLCRDEIEVTRNVLKWGKANIEQIDYTDMIWLPCVLNFATKRNLYNWVMVDEAQDTTIAEQELLNKCFKRGARFIVVADRFQQINVWCGATEEAIDNFKKYPNTEEFSLPITYRCPSKVVELANKYSDNIKAADNAIEGEIRYDVSKFSPTANDMVLCRITAPLIKLHLDYIRINKKSYIKGFNNLRDNYLNLVNSVKEGSTGIIDGECRTTNGLVPLLYKKLLGLITKIKETYGLDDDDAISHSNVFTLYDDIQAIIVISEGLTTIDELIDKIGIIFSGSETDAVQLSTVHRAKGLEANNVFILEPSLMPSKYAQKPWEIKTEKNLIYVAYTRAKNTLSFIKEEQNTFKHEDNEFNPKNIKENIELIKIKLKYNEKASISQRLVKPKKLGEKINENNITTLKPKKKTAASKFKVFLK